MSEDQKQERVGSKPSSKLCGDRPDSDPASDRLGYAPTARAIAETIRANRDRTESFVYGVHGRWGSGKTTVLRYVEHDLKDEIDRKALFVVHFNPWWFSGEETLFAVFFDELLATIGEPLGSKAKSVLQRFGSGVSGLSGPIKFGMGLVPGLNLLPEEARSAIVEAFGAAGEQENRSLFDTRQVLERVLEDSSFRTLVIIDDIDRLTVNEQLAIFRLVKSVADLPKVDYLLAFDDHLAERALQSRPEYSVDGAYLEKIVQGVFHLPVLPRYVLSDWFVTSLNDITRDGENLFVVNEESHWQCVLTFIVVPTLTTPRQVVRLVDTLRAAWPSARGEVDLADFVGLHTIRLFRKQTYAVIRAHQRWLTDESSTEDLTLDDDRDQRKFESILHDCGESVSAQKEAEEMLAALFPRASMRARDSFRFTHNMSSASVQRLRLSEPTRFLVYFGQPPSEMTLSRMDLISIVKNPFKRTVLDALLDKCTTSERRGGGSMGPVFVDELASMLEEVEAEVWPGLLESLLERGDELVTRTDREQAGLGRSPVNALTRLLQLSMTKIEQTELASLLMRAVDRCHSPATITHLLGMIDRQQSESAKEEKSSAEPVPKIDHEVLVSLLGKLHERLLEKLDAEKLDALPDPRTLIMMWRDFAPDERLVKCLIELEKTMEGRKRLAALLTGHGGRSSDGPFDLVLEWPEGPVNIEHLAAAIKQDAKQVPESDLDPVLEKFLKAVECQRHWR